MQTLIQNKSDLILIMIKYQIIAINLAINRYFEEVSF